MPGRSPGVQGEALEGRSAGQRGPPRDRPLGGPAAERLADHVADATHAAAAQARVAAEAAGVAQETFRHWMNLGGKRRGPMRYRAFRTAVYAAAAQARVAAELAVYQDDPRTWLTKGPGRETTDTPGWSGVVRPVVALTDNRSVNLLADPGSSALLTMSPRCTFAIPGGNVAQRLMH